MENQVIMEEQRATITTTGSTLLSTISTSNQNLKKVNLYLTEEIVDELRSISKETGVPASELVRRSLKTMFVEYREQKKWERLAHDMRESDKTRKKKR